MNHTQTTPPVLELRGVHRGFGTGTRRLEVLAGIDLEIRPGEFVAIVGFSGSGKTTLINLLAGLLAPDSGAVLHHGQPMTGPGPDRGVVFQNYSLLPWLTVIENVRLALDEVSAGLSENERQGRALQIVELVNLGPARDKRPAELSGGMRQRVSVARALAMQPEVLLLDEPLGALDALTRANLQDELARLRRELRQTIVLITNDPDEALYLADRVVPLTAGPRAVLGRSIQVTLPHTRDRRTLGQSPDYRALRQQIICFLTASRRDRAVEVTRKLVLPDIEPEDLSQPPPLHGGRRGPVRRAEVHRETVHTP